MCLDDEDPIITCFRKLGESPIDIKLVNSALPEWLQPLEGFVCQVYKSHGPKTLPALRWELFRTKNLEGEMVPPTRASLLPHLVRANYITMRDKSYVVTHPHLPPVSENGWTLEDDVIIPVHCLELPAPKAVLELIKCSCKTGCKSGKCSCSKNDLPCSPQCKCYWDDCENQVKEVIDVDDEDDSEY